MKVALIGNMNNNFSSLVRYLRDRGIDAELLLLKNELSHFHPSHDTFDLSYQEYSRQLSWGDLAAFYKSSPANLREGLAAYDFIIACGTAPAYLHKAGRPIDIMVPYGSDFYELPFVFHPQYGLMDTLRRCKSSRFFRSQKMGVREACIINKPISIAVLKKNVNRLNVSHKILFFGIPMVYSEIYSMGKITSFYHCSAWYHEFKKIRDRFDMVVFHHSRHIWKTFFNKFSYKSNDVLIRAFSRFIKEKPGINACLILFEYGLDVNASKELIAQLGIERNICWFPMMSRKEILVGLSLADIGTGQFFNGGLGGGVVQESLALGKPLLHYKQPALQDEKGLSDYPFIYVKTEQDIYRALNDYWAAPAAFREIGRQAEKWYSEVFAKKCVDAYIQLIEAKEKGNFLDIIETWKREKKGIND